MFKLDTLELQTHILKELEPIQDLMDLEDYHFERNSAGSREGTYIFSDEQGYHFVYSERGLETTHKVTEELFEITFWVIMPVVDSIVFDLLRKNIDSIENQRKYIYEQELLFLEKIGPNYKKAGEIRIDEKLKEDPL